jgi:hypothetical protein
VVDMSRRIVSIDAADIENVKRLAGENGVDVRELVPGGIEPVTRVWLVLMGASLAVGTVVYQIEKLNGGQVIDLRENASKIVYRSKDLVYGLVVIITSDGQVKIEVHEPRSMFGEVIYTLQRIIVEVGSNCAADIAEAARKSLGHKATVELANEELDV